MDSDPMTSVYERFEDSSEFDINYALSSMRLTSFKDSMEDMSIYIGEESCIKPVNNEGLAEEIDNYLICSICNGILVDP
jgi:hypothetical protein